MGRLNGELSVSQEQAGGVLPLAAVGSAPMKEDDMQMGYVFTKDGDTAFELFADDRVRFAASLDEGSGFVAYDGSGAGFEQYGTVHEVQNFVSPFFVPKRWRGMGREVYSMVPELFIPMLREMRSVTGVAQITSAMLLVESDGPIGIGVDWQAGVVEFKDKRTASELELVEA